MELRASSSLSLAEISASQHPVKVGASELSSCWPPLLLHQVGHVGVGSPAFTFFFYLEVWAVEFGNYLDFFGVLGLVAVPLEELLQAGWHRSGIQLEMSRMDGMEEIRAYSARKTESLWTYPVSPNCPKGWGE